MSEQAVKPLSTPQNDGVAIGFSRLQATGLPTEADRERALAQTFDAMRAERRPNVSGPSSSVKFPAERMRPPPGDGRGFIDAVPIAPPVGIGIIDRLVDAALGPAFRRPKGEGQ